MSLKRHSHQDVDPALMEIVKRLTKGTQYEGQPLSGFCCGKPVWFHQDGKTTPRHPKEYSPTPT